MSEQERRWTRSDGQLYRWTKVLGLEFRGLGDRWEHSYRSLYDIESSDSGFNFTETFAHLEDSDE